MIQMSSRGLPVLLAVVALAAPTTAPAAPAAVELRYGYEAGKSYRSVIESVSEVRIASEETEAGGALESLRDLRQAMTMTWRLSFLPGESPETLSFEATLAEVGLRLWLEGEEAPLPDGALGTLEGMRLSGAMDARGRLSAVRVDAGGGAGAAELGDEMASLSPELPEGKLSPGESFSWARSVVFPAPPELGEAIEGTVEAIYTLREVSKRKAVFDVRTTISLAPGEAAEAVALSGTGEGEAVFDLERGFFVSSELTLKIARELASPPGARLEAETRLVTTTGAVPD